MQKIPLYRFTRPDGGVTTSPVKPDVEYAELFRLVAGEGMTLTDGVNYTTCTDTATPDIWQEIPDVEMTEVGQKAAAYDMLV